MNTDRDFETVIEETLLRLIALIDIDKKSVEDFFRDMFMYAPHQLRVVCHEALDLIKRYPEWTDIIVNILQDICDKKDTKFVVSACIYASKFGFKYRLFPSILPFESDFFIQKVLKVNQDSIKEYINNLEVFIEFISKDIQFDMVVKDGILFHKILLILENYKFDIEECLDQLKGICDVEMVYIGILYLIDKEDNFYLVKLLIKVIEEEECTVTFFKLLPLFNKSFYDLLLPFIYENFINKSHNKQTKESSLFINSADIIKLKERIDNDTIKVLMKYCSQISLNTFVPESKGLFQSNLVQSIDKETFDKEFATINFEDISKKEMFRKFCLLGSPSVTHFLSYLEVYKNMFIMNSNEQVIFLKVFYDLFKSKDSFKRIVLGKMVQFNFLQKELVESYI